MNYDEQIKKAIEEQLLGVLDKKTVNEVSEELSHMVTEDFQRVTYHPDNNNIVVECKNTTYTINSLTLQMHKETND